MNENQFIKQLLVCTSEYHFHFPTFKNTLSYLRALSFCVQSCSCKIGLMKTYTQGWNYRVAHKMSYHWLCM